MILYQIFELYVEAFRLQLYSMCVSCELSAEHMNYHMHMHARRRASRRFHGPVE